MALTDKEIALELTKITVEHFNTRVTKGVNHSGLTDETIESFYKRFHEMITNLNGRHSK